MARVITQETFDEVVKENIEEFEMTPEDAVLDAIAQFEAQGINLSNIMTDLAIGCNHEYLVTETVTKLKNIWESDAFQLEDIIKELDVLKAECSKDIAHRLQAGKDGAYKLLIKILSSQDLKEINDSDFHLILKVLNTLTALMDMQPDLLDVEGIALIKSILSAVENEEIELATLKWTSICCIKHEMNRQKLYGKNITEHLKQLLNTCSSEKLLSEALNVIRKLTLDDDIRVEFGKAHEHAREMGAQMLESLVKLLKVYSKPPLASELMLTIASLLVRHELCKMAADADISCIFAVLADNFDNVAVIQQAAKMITALAGHDGVKKDLVKIGICPVLIMVLKRHISNATATALILKCIGAIALREPTHSKLLLSIGAPEVIVECLKVHPNDATVQKNACRAIRNIVARCRDDNYRFHELGIAVLLNAAHEKFYEEFGYDIRSALRDLNCTVRLDEQWTGKGVQMQQQ